METYLRLEAVFLGDRFLTREKKILRENDISRFWMNKQGNNSNGINSKNKSNNSTTTTAVTGTIQQTAGTVIMVTIT